MNNSQMISEVRAEEGEMKKPVIMWAVFGPKGEMFPFSVRRTQREAISTVVGKKNPWEWYRDRGCRVAKVEVREIE